MLQQVHSTELLHAVELFLLIFRGLRFKLGGTFCCESHREFIRTKFCSFYSFICSFDNYASFKIWGGYKLNILEWPQGLIFDRREQICASSDWYTQLWRRIFLEVVLDVFEALLQFDHLAINFSWESWSWHREIENEMGIAHSSWQRDIIGETSRTWTFEFESLEKELLSLGRIGPRRKVGSEIKFAIRMQLRMQMIISIPIYLPVA